MPKDYIAGRRKDLPTLKELEAAANRLADKGINALARMALKCMEEGAFKQDRKEYKRSGDDA